MCIGCFNHLLADGRLKNEQASCPSCRTEISSKSASRNLAVEKAVSELPSHCDYCKEEFPRHEIPHHKNDLCEQRYVFYLFPQNIYLNLLFLFFSYLVSNLSFLFIVFSFSNTCARLTSINNLFMILSLYSYELSSIA